MPSDPIKHVITFLLRYFTLSEWTNTLYGWSESQNSAAFMAVSQLWEVVSSVQFVLTHHEQQYLTRRAGGIVAGRPSSGCTWARSSMSAPMVSGYQTQHIDWRKCSAFRKACADQASMPHLWESFNSGPHHFPILITVTFASCWPFDGTSRQAYIETVCHSSISPFFFFLYHLPSAGF